MIFEKSASSPALIRDASQAPRNVRALIVDLSKRYGGASTRTIALAHQLQPYGAMIAGLKDSPVVSEARKHGIPVRTVGKYRLDPTIPFRLSRIIRDGHYQVIDTQNVQSKLWGSIAAYMTNTALVSTLNSWYETEHGDSLKGKLYTAIELWTNRQTDYYIAVSDEVRKALLNAGVADKSVALIHNAIDLDADAIQVDAERFRGDLGLPPDAIVCVTAGRLVWAKGLDNLISAFRQVADKLPNVYAVIVGSGPIYSELTTQIDRAGLQNRIFLLGYREHDEVLKILKSSNIFVMPSRTEGTPLALLEAAALGKPILATCCGGIPEIVTDKIEALLVPVDDIYALANALIKLCLDTAYASELGVRAQARNNSDFDHFRFVEATWNVYVRAFERRSGYAVFESR